MEKNKNNKLNFIVTGSNGWISQNFISYIKTNLPEANIFEINRENGLSSINEYYNLENVFLIHNVFTRAEYLINKISKFNIFGSHYFNVFCFLYFETIIFK